MILGAGGAAVAAGATGVLAVMAPSRHPVPDRQDTAPDFSVVSVDGRTHYRLADFAGTVLLLNFWATWCAPCRLEMPWLARTYARYRSRGLAILGVNMDDGDLPAVASFAREMGAAYPIARGNAAIVASYGGVRFLPESFLIGQRGQLLRRAFGMPSTHDLEAAMVTALSRS